MKNTRPPFHLNRCIPLIALAWTAMNAGAITLFNEEFDGTVGYNVSSATALVGDNDWVDFSDRLTASAVGLGGIEGYATAFGGTETVLTGAPRAGQNDPQIRSDFEPGFDKTLVNGLELRLRIDLNLNGTYDDTLTAANFNVYWGTQAYATPGAVNGPSQLNFNFGSPTAITAQGEGWYLATWTITPGSLTQGTNGVTVRSLRVDPVNNVPGASYELDYLRVTAVPEPGVAALILLGIGWLSFARSSRSV